ncbi:hypothetical protein G5I_10074 [Acromyrmex echinatior]|uniref:Uncharacterized protein n=1 Tax=Acromyrmex echinatior TaxID=103372 RepID=F4WVX2_ACREC|nr:hypothetical protein G5I_10074 [Acromyrmex echinatior]
MERDLIEQAAQLNTREKYVAWEQQCDELIETGRAELSNAHDCRSARNNQRDDNSNHIEPQRFLEDASSAVLERARHCRKCESEHRVQCRRQRIGGSSDLTIAEENKFHTSSENESEMRNHDIHALFLRPPNGLLRILSIRAHLPMLAIVTFLSESSNKKIDLIGAVMSDFGLCYHLVMRSGGRMEVVLIAMSPHTQL